MQHESTGHHQNDSSKRNRLANETSPYLLQHAYNPVDWYPWGEEALKKAKSENKPIFLSIGYSACHWNGGLAPLRFFDIRSKALLCRNLFSKRRQQPLQHAGL